jgi:hypothetical protein
MLPAQRLEAAAHQGTSCGIAGSDTLIRILSGGGRLRPEMGKKLASPEILSRGEKGGICPIWLMGKQI